MKKLEKKRIEIKQKLYLNSLETEMSHLFNKGFLGFDSLEAINPGKILSKITSYSRDLEPFLKMKLNDDNISDILDTIKKDLFIKEPRTYIHLDSESVGNKIWIICASDVLHNKLDEYFKYKKYAFSELFVAPISGRYFAIWETEKDIEFFRGNLYDE